MAPLQYPKHRTKLCERWLILFSLDPRIQSTMSSRSAKVGLMLLLAAGGISIPLQDSFSEVGLKSALASLACFSVAPSIVLS
jgi:hypothetical protein